MQDALDRLRKKIEMRGLNEAAVRDKEGGDEGDGKWVWLPGKTEDDANKYGGYWTIVPDVDQREEAEKGKKFAGPAEGRRENVRPMQEDGYWEIIPD
eukprot:758768-Hanusia_phi.AAC.3